MAGNMKVSSKILLGLSLICCLGFLLIVAPQVEARVPVSEDWLRTYGFSRGVDGAMAIATDRLGNVYVTGGSYDPAEERQAFATIKYSPTGEQLWVARYYGYDYALPHAISVDDSGFVYVTGITYHDGLDEIFFITVKYGPQGQSLGGSGGYFGTDYTDKPVAQAMDPSGNLYITGTMHLPSWQGVGVEGRIVTYKLRPGDVFPVFIDIKGTGSEDYRAIDMVLDNAGNVIVTGVNKGTNEYITIKYNSNCQLIWEQTYAAGLNTNPVSVAVDADNNVYVFGYARDGIRSTYCTLKYREDGTLRWRQTHDPGHQNLLGAAAMKVDAAGNIYAAGYVDSANKAAEYYTFKYNTEGVLQWTKRYAGPGQAPNYAFKLGLDRFANIYVTGTWGDYQSGSSAIATVSYDPAGVLRWETMEDGRITGPSPSLPKEKGKVTRGPLMAVGLAVGPGDNVHLAGSHWDEFIGPDYFVTFKYQQGVRR